MSKRTHLTKFGQRQQNNIKHILLQNGYDTETLNIIWNNLIIGDVDDIIDLTTVENVNG